MACAIPRNFRIAENEPAGTVTPIERVVLEALQHVDEFERLDLSEVPTSGIAFANPPANTPDAVEKLGSLESLVLDLATLGTSVREILDELPQFDSEIYEALLALLDQDLIRIK